MRAIITRKIGQTRVLDDGQQPPSSLLTPPELLEISPGTTNKENAPQSSKAPVVIIGLGKGGVEPWYLSQDNGGGFCISAIAEEDLLRTLYIYVHTILGASAGDKVGLETTHWGPWGGAQELNDYLHDLRWHIRTRSQGVWAGWRVAPQISSCTQVSASIEREWRGYMCPVVCCLVLQM